MSIADKHNNGRRQFIKTGLTAGALFSIVPPSAVAGLAKGPLPSDQLNIAGIGVGGMGITNLQHLSSENIVAICDVDQNYASHAFRTYTQAKQYADYRHMFDEMKNIDAVVVATPDHTHAVIARAAMQLGYHVYLQAPLAHSVYETRILTETARRYEVATQMGNQGSSDDGINEICESIWSGAIGEVTHVDAWTNSPTWKQNLNVPNKKERVPKELNWDLFLGPATNRAYSEQYTPWNWRAWWDFGTGGIGNMGCHVLDSVFRALKLKYPEAVESSSTGFSLQSSPASEKITYHFPRRDNLPKVGFPALTLTWHDGGLLPTRPEALKNHKFDAKGGCIFYGSKGILACGEYGKNSAVYMKHGELTKSPEKSLRRISNALTGGHEMDWVRACKENKENRVEAKSNFEMAGPLSEAVLLGNVAVRLQSIGRRLEWDGENMRFKNITNSDRLSISDASAVQMEFGDTKAKTINPYADEMASEWLRHKYRDGWGQI
ncbi:MAG: Gfo/Idh/MocA family protein [Bacteroidales bacterium]